MAAALLRLSLGRDRQPCGGCAVSGSGPAPRPWGSSKTDRSRHPAADRRRFLVGCARSPRSGSADGLFRVAIHLRLPVPVRVRQFHAVGRAGIPCLWAVAAARPAPTGGCEELAVRAYLAWRFLLPF